jgi:hypothetical protein
MLGGSETFVREESGQNYESLVGNKAKPESVSDCLPCCVERELADMQTRLRPQNVCRADVASRLVPESLRTKQFKRDGKREGTQTKPPEAFLTSFSSPVEIS